MIREDWLVEAATHVADGRPVDWDDLENSASHSDQEEIRQLRVLAEIALLHRRLIGTDLPGSAPAEQEPGASDDSGTGPPTQWGSLLLQARLGGGNYGDVYRAWDPTLQRSVALKLLRRSGHSSDGVVREGQLLARVNHPNVMAVFGAQAIDGQVGIWGELLNGRTLSEIVQDQGPFGPDEALVVAEALCRALAAAHRAGLLHRDVKAQNVIRETGGRIVLTDFGLGHEVDDTQTPVGAGTPLYMAPELFEGGVPSVQTDLYSLGVLLFYLATATFPVTGATVQELIENHRHGIRTRLQDLRPELPRAFVQLVERAIAVDPATRFTSTAAMLDAITAAMGAHGDRSGIDESHFTRRRALMTLSLVVSGTLAGVAVGRYLAPAGGPDNRSKLVAVEPPVGSRFSDSSRGAPAVSPDGRHIAIPATDVATGEIHLWLHSLETAEARRLPDTERALAPFWEPDSQMLGFFEPGGTIKRVNLDGVSLGHIPTGAEPRGASWSRNGLLLYSKGPRSGLYAHSLATGNERVVVEPDAAAGELGYMWPQFLPDGEAFIFFVLSNDRSVRGVYLGSLGEPRATRLVSTDASATLLGDSQLLFVRAGNLVAQRFSHQRRTTIGPPVTVLENVAVNFDWRSVVSASHEGTVAYLPAVENTSVTWFRRDGARDSTVSLEPGRLRSPALSRNGQMLAVQRYRDGLSEIQVVDLGTGRTRPPLAHSADVQFPVWGPGSRLAYASSDSGSAEIYIKDFDRDDPPVRLPVAHPDIAGGDKMPTDWSPDGTHLLVTVRSPGRPYEVWAVPVGNGSAAFPLRPGEGSQVSGRFAPDGLRALYLRRGAPTRDGSPPERELWACDFPSGQTPTRLGAGAVDPAWVSRHEISYFDRAGRLSLFAIAGGTLRGVASIEVGVNTPEAARNNYAWAPDASRVLVNARADNQPGLRVMVLLNAADRLVNKTDVTRRTDD